MRAVSTNYPPGVSDRDIDGDQSLKPYTIEITARAFIMAKDDDEAVREAIGLVENAGPVRVTDSDILDSEPVN